MLKKLFHGGSSILLHLTLFLAIITASAMIVLDANHIKSWIGKSDAYVLLPGVILDHAKNNTELSTTIPLDNPSIRTSAKEAFSPSFVQTSTESFIDSIFRWLNGATPKPDFSIDILTQKQQFARSVADYAKVRYTALPACAAGTLPVVIDPLTMDCRPESGVDIALTAQQIEQTIAENQDFLGQQKLTIETVMPGDTSTSVFHNNSLPNAYQAARYTPIVLTVLAILNFLVVLFTSETKRKGLKRLSTVLILTGIIAGFSVWGGSIAAGAIQSNANGATNTWTAIIKNLIASSVYAMQHDVMMFGLSFAGSVVGLGVIIMVVLRLTNRGAQPAKNSSVPTVARATEKPANTKIPAKKTQTATPKALPKSKPIPIVKPGQQPKPTIIKPTEPLGSSNKLIQ